MLISVPLRQYILGWDVLATYLNVGKFRSTMNLYKMRPSIALLGHHFLHSTEEGFTMQIIVKTTNRCPRRERGYTLMFGGAGIRLNSIVKYFMKIIVILAIPLLVGCPLWILL